MNDHTYGKSPKIEVDSDDEPSRKRAKTTENLIPEEETLEKMIHEALEKKTRHLEERILKVESENSELKEKNSKLESMQNSLEEQVQKLQKDSLQKDIKIQKHGEILRAKVREMEAKISNLESRKSHQKNPGLQNYGANAPTSSNIPILPHDNYKQFIHSDVFSCSLTPAEINCLSECIFCGAKNKHNSIDCMGSRQFDARIRVLLKKNRCTKCLEFNDPRKSHVCSRANVMCSNCQWDPRQARIDLDFHHPIVCPLNDKDPSCVARRETENARRLAHGQPPRSFI